MHLFPRLNSSLIELLESLSPGQWNSPTVCKLWTVKDIAAHLLDTALRRLSGGRDDYRVQNPEINSYAELVEFLNALNADWVKAYKRVSPAVLTKQIVLAQDEFYKYVSAIDMFAPALYPVSWAGESESLLWFDIAREYTEQWHHQQQIRLAVGAPSILERELYYPFLEISMRALPHHYRTKSAPAGTAVTLKVVGDAGGSWTIVRTESGWAFGEPAERADTEVYIDQNIAWLLLSRGVKVAEAEQYWQISGNYELGYHALLMTAFMV